MATSHHNSEWNSYEIDGFRIMGKCFINHHFARVFPSYSHNSWGLPTRRPPYKEVVVVAARDQDLRGGGKGHAADLTKGASDGNIICKWLGNRFKWLSIWWFPKIRVPPVLIHLSRVFRYKQSSYWGTHTLGNPDIYIAMYISIDNNMCWEYVLPMVTSY